MKYRQNFSKNTVVVYTLNAWESSLALLRVIGPASASGYRVIPGNRMEIVSPKLVSVGDIVVIQRDFPRMKREYLQVRDRAKSEGKLLIYELDDLLFEIPTSHPDNGSEFYKGAYLPMMQALLDADAVFVSTPILQEYAQKFNQQIRVLPNYLNDDLWKMRPPRKTPVDGPIVITYIGSTTHQNDLREIESALHTICIRYKSRIRLDFHGSPPPDIISNHPNVSWHALNLFRYQDYINYLSQQDGHIAIAPMQDQLFNRSKSAIKQREYAALGLAGVFSKMPPYENVVEHGVNGYLASTSEEWVQAISTLIEDEELRLQIAGQAQADLRRNWLLSGHRQDWMDLVASIPQHALGQSQERPSSERIERALINLRVALAPPGSQRDWLLMAPARTIEILSTEGLTGLSARLQERFGAQTKTFGTPWQASSKSEESLNAFNETTKPGKIQKNVREEGRRTAATPKTSIVLLTHNNLNYTRLCLKSIFERTSYSSFEVIVVDNASSDGTAEYVTTLSREHPSLRLIANSANVGFAAGNNQGARTADGEVIAFLNNDTVVTQNWLRTLVSHLDNPKAGMVGPVTNSSGNESRIPVDYRNLNEMQAFAQGYCQEHTGEYFDIPMLAFMCVAIRRSVFEEVGPLDESFGLGMFEDDDYALRLKQAGYRILCARDAFVHHWGSASFSRLNRKEFFRIYNQNRRKFEQKWGVRWTRHQSSD